MLKVAILGANGFIGSRAVEMFHLGELAQVRPVVRQFASLVRTARFNLDCRIADAFDQSALRSAFADCDIVVDLVLGDPGVIVGTVAPVYQAANEAGVGRLIYVSSASVHGQAPKPGTTEESPITTAQQLPYNSAKVRAERRLLRERENGSTEVVILRPGIVFGPRSRWTAGLADQLLSGTAYLINEGNGICNSLYVDNLIEAIRLSMTASGADRQVFLLGDQETVTWADLYRPIALALGIELDEVPHLSAPEFRPNLKRIALQARASTSVQRLLPLIPSPVKRSIKAALVALGRPEQQSPWSLGPSPGVVPTQEITILQQCKYKLPSDKARTVLNYSPTVSFEEGCRRSVGWLRFAGYPVVRNVL